MLLLARLLEERDRRGDDKEARQAKAEARRVEKEEAQLWDDVMREVRASLHARGPTPVGRRQRA